MHRRVPMDLASRAALIAAAALGSLGSLLVTLAAAGDAAGAGDGRAPPCDAVEVSYALSANLQLTDTTMGQGDGTHRIGPGSTVLRYHVEGGEPTGPVEMIAYEMHERFRIDSNLLFWNTHVTTDAKTTVSADPCGVVARGVLTGDTIEWTSEVRAQTDGTLTCVGSLCGKLGAPAPGTSPLHVANHESRLRPWSFAPDKKTFTMQRTWLSHSESPKQTSFVALAGREVRRTCAPEPPPAPTCAP
jgi:hypothetical protein